jgi:hypothetical protein
VGFFSDYVEINDEGVRVASLLSSKTIPYCEIKRVRKVTFWKALREGINPFNPCLFSSYAPTSHVILIETTHSRIAVNPKDRDQFFRTVLDHLRNFNANPP